MGELYQKQEIHSKLVQAQEKLEGQAFNALKKGKVDPRFSELKMSTKNCDSSMKFENNNLR